MKTSSINHFSRSTHTLRRICCLMLFSISTFVVSPSFSQARYITISSPANNTYKTAPASVTVTVETLDIVDVGAVKIYQDNVVIRNSVGVGVHSITVNNLPPGDYIFRGTAEKRAPNPGTQSTETRVVHVVAPGNVPPNVSVNPPEGAPFLDPATVHLTATASDSDGSVSSVQYFANGSSLIGSSNAAPYAVTWAPVSTGSYSVTALATDNLGNTRTSQPVSLAINPSVIRGNIDGIGINESGVYQILGWACSSGRELPVDIHLYLGGPAGSGTGGFPSYIANLGGEPGIGAACQTQTGNHRFSIPITEAMRASYPEKSVYVHGISPSGTGNSVIDSSGVFLIPRLPPALAHTRRYVYNEYEELCKTIEPESGATVMHYDGAGNLDWSAAGLTLPSATTCDESSPQIDSRRVVRTYDAQDRLKTLRFPDSLGNQNWNYYPDGLVSSISTTNRVGVQDVYNDYAYNELRQLTSETQRVPSWYSNTIGYDYSQNGSLQSIIYPSGQTLNYFPNALGQPTSLASMVGNVYAREVAYYPNGALKRFVYGNGIEHRMEQNPRQLPNLVVDTGVLNSDYGYDKNGNVDHTWDDATQGLRGRIMRYDGLDRLVETFSPVFGGDGYARYTYDGLDNLIKVNASGRDQTYYHDPSTNRLSNIINNITGTTVVGLGYDAQGNLQNKNGQSYEFDYGNRLRQATGLELYRYDGYGRRIVATNLVSGVVRSQYSSGGQLMYQTSSRRNVDTDFIYLSGSLIAERETPIAGGAEVITYQHTDALGTPVAVTNSIGAVLGRFDYEPYGEQIGGLRSDTPGYTGHMLDTATRLNYMQQRYYDPAIGKFLSVDPVTADDSSGDNFNRYWYADNNPYKLVDPDGRRACGKNTTCRLEQGESGGVMRFNGSSAGIFVRAKTPSSQARLMQSVGSDPKLLEYARDTHESFVSALIGLVTGGGFGGAKSLKGVATDAKFAQKTYSAIFGAEGKFAGRSVDEVASALRTGAMRSSDIPVSYIVRNGETLMLNTRSAKALELGGIPRSQWNGINRTGENFFEKLLDGQLSRNPGAPFEAVRRAGGK